MTPTQAQTLSPLAQLLPAKVAVKSAAATATECQARATVARDKGDEPVHDALTGQTQTAALQAFWLAHPESHAQFEARGIGAATFAAGVTLAAQYTAACALLPQDRRDWEQLTPDQKTRIEVIARERGAYMTSLVQAARKSSGLEALKVLGRGMRVSPASAPSVLAAVQEFLQGAPSRVALLTAAHFTQADIATIEGWVAELSAYPGMRSGRLAERETLAANADTSGLALDAYFDLLRGAGGLALKDSPTLLASFLGKIPRAPERRKAPAAAAPAPVAAQPAVN